MRDLLIRSLTILALSSFLSGQTAWQGLTPGISKRADVERKLGRPLKAVSETLHEFSDKSGQKIYVQYRAGSDLVDRIEVLYTNSVERDAVVSSVGLVSIVPAKKWDTRGRLEEYFGSPRNIVLTYGSSFADGRVIRAGYYSSDLFAVAIQKPVGTPQPASANTSAAPLTSTRPDPKTFKDVELLVPKGDKSESKSVRLLFDGVSMIIDADRGEKIYKQFAYSDVASGEYSYSSSPRWKTAIGAAVLIGVFALPIFFMKSRKHWLTVKTGNDFAIMQLDKKNYRMILATFETSVGKKVETVADTK